MKFSEKYKAMTFDEIVGHSKIVNEFKDRSKTNDFPNVMFFIGNPGCGKTILSTITAKLLNCKEPNLLRDGTKEPCNQCVSCTDVNEEKFNRDILLLDASSMSKDDVIKLKDTVSYYPLHEENKIIIIDEAQELGKAGKGAILKLLEKQRKNVYFILCTMSKDAFDAATKRRGQAYLFREVDSFEIVEYLMNILTKENLVETVPETFITSGLYAIAENCDGSPGVALPLLERCIRGNIYEEQEIIKELGLITYKTGTDTLEKLLNKDLSVFEDLRSLDLKEFYNKAFKILNEAYVYHVSRYIDQEWKIKMANRLDKNKILELLSKFNNVKSDPYFKESSFYHEIIMYYKVSRIPA